MTSQHMQTGCCDAPCPSCEPQTPVRNHYFFGKLMDVPDFDVEQAYVVEKFKRHHARLHGRGVICGLEVFAHQNPACRERYLVVKPGAAIDCCGNEILVLNEEVVDITGFPAVRQLADQPDTLDHLLLLCLRYHECPTEEVPVLYDECGCDDTRCAPNRILESYEFDLVVDPPLPPSAPNLPHAPTLTWIGSVTLPAAKAVALHAASNRAYLAADLSGGTSGTVQQSWLSTQAFIAMHNFATPVFGIAANADGTKLVAAVAGAAASDPTRLAMLDTANSAAFAGAELATLDLAGSDAPSSVRLLPLGNDRFAVLLAKGGDSQVLVVEIVGGNTLNEVASATINSFAVVAGALGSDGKTLYLAPATGAMQSVDVSAAVLAPAAMALSASDLSDLAVVRSSAPDVLAWTEKSAPQIKLAKPDGTPIHQNPLPDPPTSLLVDTVGQFAYLLLQPATGDSQVVAVDLYQMLAQKPPVLSNILDVGPGGAALAVSDERLWVVYADGAAIVRIDQTHCADFLDPHACPACATPDCIVLATIPGYRPKRSLEDPTVPASDPLADAAANIARIDMLTWRLSVPSVVDLAHALRCLLDHCCTGGSGGTGSQGPPGEPGAPGKDGSDGHDGKDGKDGRDGKDGQDGKDGRDGTNGTNGTDGQDGKDATLDWDLPHICDFNWQHGEQLLAQQFLFGLVVAFDTPVLAADLHVDSIHLQVQHPDRLGEQGIPILCWCDLDLGGEGNIEPGRLKIDCAAQTQFSAGVDAQGMATAVRIGAALLPKLIDSLTTVPLKLRVLINGDFVRGVHHKSHELRALDADHLPKVDPPSPPGPPQPGKTPEWMKPQDGRFSGDGIEGGTFESWFTMQRG